MSLPSPIGFLSDQSQSFDNGFQAGMIWYAMQVGQERIELGTRYQSSNAATFDLMAMLAGYTTEVFDCCDADFEWNEIVFHKLPAATPHLKLVTNEDPQNGE